MNSAFEHSNTRPSMADMKAMQQTALSRNIDKAGNIQKAVTLTEENWTGLTNAVELTLKNVSSYAAKSIVVQPGISDESDPFSYAFETGSKSISTISANASKKVTLLVTVDKSAASKVYSVPITYTYYNGYMEAFTSTDTVYFKITNPYSAPTLTLADFTVSPDYIAAGDTGTVSAYIVNSGTIAVYDVAASLGGLDTSAISISNGVNTQRIEKIDAGTRQMVTFSVATNGDMSSGNYPLTLKVGYTNDQGTEYSQEFEVFVNVGGAAGANKGILEITDMQEPSGTYGVNETFAVRFNLANTGTGKAKNITVTAEPAKDDGSVVAKSASMKAITEMAPGETAALEFSFAATSESVSRNYSILITVEYETTSGTEKTFKQFAGADVSNPDSSSSIPKIIVSDYLCDPLIVMAGEEFDLYLTCLNTHKSKAVENIKMYLTMTEESSTDDEDESSGNVFTPVNSSNTFYFDSIPSKGTIEKELRLFVVPDAAQKTYTLTVNFEYEDADGNQYTSTELLGINVEQVTEIQTGDIYLPEKVEIGADIDLEFDIFNTGKVTVSNLMVTLEGDIESTAKSTYIGNCKSGDTESYEGSFSLAKEGKNDVKVIVSYDDASNDHVENVYEFTVEAVAAAAGSAGEGPEGMGGPGGGNVRTGMTGLGGAAEGAGKKVLTAVISIGAAVAAAIIVLKVRKKRKARREEAFLSADDYEEEANDIGEGNDINEDQ